MNLLNQNHKTEQTVAALNELLANLHIHYQKLRNYHWNVQGEHFFNLHNKFEEMYNAVKIRIDEVAERILTLGSHPVSTLSEYLEASMIKETRYGLSDTEMVESISGDIRILVMKMRAVLEHSNRDYDNGTEDMITGYIAASEKDHWMLSAFLNRKLEPAKLHMN
ncbi:MAG: Dps family protein [Bacteroidia bacterium]